MADSNYKITISGPGVLPETTRASDLGEFLTNIEKAISETALSRGIKVTDQDIVSLTSIEKSSNKLTFTVAGILLTAASSVSEAIQTKKYERLPRQAHEALYQVSKQAIKHEWQVKFEENKALGIKGGVISKENQVPPAQVTYIEGTTSIYGRCIRVGGLTPKVEIQLYQGGTIFITLSEQMARELARSLYEDVCIEGIAKWNTDDWTIEEFYGTRVREFRATDPVEAFKNLAVAARGKWDGVDAIQYVKGLRSESGKA
jgi:hypothetical protein